MYLSTLIIIYIMDKIKNLLAVIVNFTTGLGFYGIGLLGVAAGLTFLFGWGGIPAGFVGAFVFKNWAQIVAHFKGEKN